MENFKAVLVGVNYKDIPYSIDNSMKELASLAQALDIEVVGSFVQNLDYRHVKTYIGTGKVVELKGMIHALEANLVIMNEELTPSQLQSLETGFEVEVIDRTYLILEIFSKRARTKEARLQVEIARLQYMLPRLIGMNESVYSQQGGSGFRGGGETQLELDRRRIKKEMAAAKKELDEAVHQRQIQRGRRKKHEVPLVALVGYTNSGKSSLLNRFLYEYGDKEKSVFAKDMLFATLETSTRMVDIENKHLLLTDTVGFVDQLPTTLVKAFRSTLEEVCEADLLIHVVDASNPSYETQMKVTNHVLEEIGVKDIPMLYVFNKMDKCETILKQQEDAVYMSVLHDPSLEVLVTKIINLLFNEIHMHILLPYTDMKYYNYIKEHGTIIFEEANEVGYDLHIKIASRDEHMFLPFLFPHIE